MPRIRYNKIPLRRRDGSLCAYTLVDPEDYTRFNGQKWSLQTVGYAQGWDAAARKVRTLHRMILGLPVTGNHKQVVDHINGDKLDNRRANLRYTSQRTNARSLRGAQKNSKSGILYVHPKKNRWMVQAGGKVHGHFATVEEAAVLAEELRLARVLDQ